MKVYQPRWTCFICGRKNSKKIIPKIEGVCDKCGKRSNPNLYSLNKVPQQYFEFEKIKVEGIKLEE